MNYKEIDFNIRIAESQRLLNKYPDKIPIIVNGSKNISINKHKYLVPNTLSCGQFLYILRKRINLNPTQSLFMFINNTLPTTSAIMNDLYKIHKDSDLFLYIFINEENTFGSKILLEI